MPGAISTYQLHPDYANVKGLTILYAGCPFLESQMFDVVQALVLAGGSQFSICDNALKEVLNTCPQLLLTSDA